MRYPPQLSPERFPLAHGVEGPLAGHFTPYGRRVAGASSGPLGWHSLSQFLICQRKGWYYLTSGVPPRSVSEYMTVGTGVHAALAQQYEAVRCPQEELLSPADAAIAAIHEDVGSDPFEQSAGWETTAARVLTITEQYLQASKQEIIRFQTPHSGFEVLAVEAIYSKTYPASRFASGITRTQRVDLVLRSPAGVVFADHKVTQKRVSAARTVFSSDGQFDGYWELGQTHYGKDFAGTVLNTISYDARTAHVKCTFDRYPVAFRADWKDIIREALRRYRDAVKRQEQNREPPPGIAVYGTCHDWSNPCPFVQLCRFGGA